jgi:hypothetical protein
LKIDVGLESIFWNSLRTNLFATNKRIEIVENLIEISKDTL